MAEASAAFVSYCREDFDFARRLAKDLKSAGANVWLDTLDIVPGERWDRAIQAALTLCPRMVVILSPGSVSSENVMDEVNFALRQKKTVIPIVYRDCEIPFRLDRLQRVDFRQDYERGLQALLRALAANQGAGLITSASVDVGSENWSNSFSAVKRQVATEQERHDGMAKLLVTVHGGGPAPDMPRSNVRAYDKDGNLIRSSVLVEDESMTLNHLRGLCLVGKYLYVVNASVTESCVLCYEGSGTRYRFVSKFASSQTCKGILRPFDLTFDGLGYCYLSSMDTNTVTRLIVSSEGKTGIPAPVAAALPDTGRFLTGTFVASSNGNLYALATTPVESPAGLSYSKDGAKKHSVRGLAWANGRLYVADNPAGTVKIYDAMGKYLGQSNEVESPARIVVHNGSLYVSGGDHVLTSKLPTPSDDFVLRPISSAKVKNASGMAFDSLGNLYVASRTGQTISKFGPDFKPLKFSCYLPDDPEFLLAV